MSGITFFLSIVYIAMGLFTAVVGFVGVQKGQIKVGARGGVKTLTGSPAKRMSAALGIGGLLALVGGLLMFVNVSFGSLLGSVGALVVIVASLLGSRAASGNI